jgi:hypothetical protein
MQKQCESKSESSAKATRKATRKATQKHSKSESNAKRKCALTCDQQINRLFCILVALICLARDVDTHRTRAMAWRVQELELKPADTHALIVLDRGEVLLLEACLDSCRRKLPDRDVARQTGLREFENTRNAHGTLTECKGDARL